MLKIRLKRAGGRNRPFYRVVVVDSRKARDSRALEEIGYYNPLEKPLLINVDRERVNYWTERGAQVTDSVKTLLRRENAVHPSRRTTEAFTPSVPEPVEKPKKKVKTKAAKAAAATATEEAPAEETKTEKVEAVAEETESTAPKAEEPKAEKPKADAAPAKEAAEVKTEPESSEEAKAETKTKPAAKKKATKKKTTKKTVEKTED